MGKIYVVASGKGGTGKTTVTAGAACALALMGKKVLAVDGDTELQNLDLALGLENSGVLDYGDILSGTAAAKDVLTRHPSLESLDFLAAPGLPVSEIDREKFTALIKALAPGYDYVFIDAPAGVGTGFELASAPANRALIVSTPDTPCVKDSAEAAYRLVRRGFYEVKLVLNRVVPGLIKGENAFNIDQSMDRVGLRLAGVIFEDRRITAAFNNCAPVMLTRSKKPRRDFFDLAKRLEGRPVRPRF